MSNEYCSDQMTTEKAIGMYELLYPDAPPSPDIISSFFPEGEREQAKKDIRHTLKELNKTNHNRTVPESVINTVIDSTQNTPPKPPKRKKSVLSILKQMIQD